MLFQVEQSYVVQRLEDQYPIDKRKQIVEVDDNRPQWEVA